MFFATFNEYEEPQGFFPDSGAHRDIVDELREAFDLIVVYSESGLSNPLATILSGLADASFIVAEEGQHQSSSPIKDLRRSCRHPGAMSIDNKRAHIPRMASEPTFSAGK